METLLDSLGFLGFLDSVPLCCWTLHLPLGTFVGREKAASFPLSPVLGLGLRSQSDESAFPASGSLAFPAFPQL